MTKTLRDRLPANRRSPEEKKFAGTIDLTPTWSEILPTWLTVVRDANAKGQEAALAELTRMAKLADLYVASQKAKASTVGPDQVNTQRRVAHNAQRESIRATHYVRCEQLSIKSDVTPETIYFKHYPDTSTSEGQLHVTVMQKNGVSGAGIYLRKADALLVRDFVNEFYPTDRAD
jgi:hypothetical protein